MKVAVAGKGGVGKSTVSALLLLALRQKGIKPLLAIDADPNSNLNLLLGLNYGKTIADIRDSLRTEKIPTGMSKYEFFAMSVEEEIAEKEGIDFIAMGHPEGRECYCAVNNILREFLSRIEKNYPIVLVDNEAGLEHISRQSNGKIDWLVFVSNRDPVSLMAVKNGLKLAQKLKIDYSHSMLVINKAENNFKIADEISVDFVKNFPYSEEIEKQVLEGKPLFIPDDLREKIFEIVDPFFSIELEKNA